MAGAWFYERQGETKGPFGSEELLDLFRQGIVAPEDLVWREGENPMPAHLALAPSATPPGESGLVSSRYFEMPGWLKEEGETVKEEPAAPIGSEAASSGAVQGQGNAAGFKWPLVGVAILVLVGALILIFAGR